MQAVALPIHWHSPTPATAGRSRPQPKAKLLDPSPICQIINTHHYFYQGCLFFFFFQEKGNYTVSSLTCWLISTNLSERQRSQRCLFPYPFMKITVEIKRKDKGVHVLTTLGGEHRPYSHNYFAAQKHSLQLHTTCAASHLLPTLVSTQPLLAKP